MRRILVLLTLSTAALLASPSLVEATFTSQFSGDRIAGGTVVLTGTCSGFDGQGDPNPGTFPALFKLEWRKDAAALWVAVATGATNYDGMNYSGSLQVPTDLAGEFRLGGETCEFTIFGDAGTPQSVPFEYFTLQAAPQVTDPSVPTTIAATIPATTPTTPTPPAAAPPAAPPTATALPVTGPVTDGLPALAVSLVSFGLGCLWFARRRSAAA